MPDPVFHKELGVERHVFFVAVGDLPEDIPNDPNPRDQQNLRRNVYKKMGESLLNEGGVEAGTFHLKHKGITIVAHRVNKIRDDEYEVFLERGRHGILDGGHTHALISQLRQKQSLPAEQFVKVEVLTGVPEAWIPEIAGGLNTSVQVQDMSLDDLGGRFDWIKDELANEPYIDDIAWRENHRKPVDARELLAIFECFNIFAFPNDGDRHPVRAYEKNSLVLRDYSKAGGEDHYKAMRPILTQILTLRDRIRADAHKHYNKAYKGRGGAFAFVESRKSKPWDFPFIQEQHKQRLTKGALFPMLAAFRWMVEANPTTGKLRWKGGFKRVLRMWQQLAPELVRMTAETSKDQGRSPDAVGKSRSHWKALHTTIALRDLQSAAAVN